MKFDPRLRQYRTSLLAFSLGLMAVAGGACSNSDRRPPNTGTGGSGAGVGGSGLGTGGSNISDDLIGPNPTDDLVSDGGGTPGGSAVFPSAPILDGVTADQIATFPDISTFAPGGVCVFEPHLGVAGGAPGALFPSNWLRPRFRWTGTGSLWEIRLHAASQGNDLVAYTTGTQWIMPKDVWTKIAGEGGNGGVYDEITVTIRSSTGGGQQGTFRITPALAGGSMVFWGTKSSVVAPGASQLYGFTMGDEAVVPTLDASQVTSITKVITGNGADLRGDLADSAVAGFDEGAPRCVGCHSATPDGKAMIFTDDYPWDMGISSVEQGFTGAAPDYVSTGARKFLKIPFLGTGMMLKSYWDQGDRTLIATMGRREDTSASYIYVNYGYNDPPTFEPIHHDLVWFDLGTTETYNDTLPAIEGTDPGWTGQGRADAAIERSDEIVAAEGSAYGVLLTEGNLSISNPSPARTSNKVIYSVSETSYDGHPDWHNNTADVKIADIANIRGTNPAGAPLAGASDPAWLEYYPAFSPDDQLVAFTRAPKPTKTDRCAEGKPSVREDKDSPKCANGARSTLGENPDGPYYNAKGEIYVVPSAGGTPHRVAGNDPVACGGEVSPGVINSWPKWSSAVRELDGKRYYFVIFSSARAYPAQFALAPTASTPPIETKSSQLYMSTVEVDIASGAVTSYPAIYLWNQNYIAQGDQAVPLPTSNMTPAWEDFTIPTVPPVVVIK